MAFLLPCEIGVEFYKAMKGSRHWVFARRGAMSHAPTARAKP